MSSSPTESGTGAPVPAVGRDPGRATVLAVATTAVIAIVLHLPALVRREALNSDEATIGTIARVIRHGGSLYRDVVDRKPPGAFVLYRLLEPVFGAWTLTAGRWLTVSATVSAMWILAFEAKRRWPEVSASAVAVMGVAAFAVLPAEDSRAVGFELLATLPAVAAFVLGARRRTVLAGACLGVAALFKQPMLLGALPLTVQCLTVSTAWSRRVVRLVVAGAATTTTVLAGLAPFGLSDALTWFSGVGDNYLGGAELSTVVIVGLEQLGTVAVLTMGLSTLAAIAWRGRRMPSDVVAWIVASLLATAIGLRFILHYFNQLLPSLVLLAAPALVASRLVGRPTFRPVLRSLFRPGLPRFAQVAFGGAMAFSLCTVLAPAWFHDLPDVGRVAAAIDARTRPGDKIFVWGQAPEIYWVSHRDPVTRFPHIGFITGVTPKRPGVAPYVLSQPEATENLLADLRSNPPALIIDAAISSVRGGDRYPIETSPIASFVAENDYCEVAVVDGMRLLSACDR